MSFQKPIRKTKPALYMLINTPTFQRQREQLRPGETETGGIKARSGSEQLRMDIYLPIAAMYKKLYPICECCDAINAHMSLEPICGGTDDIHHVKGRDGYLLFDVRFFKAACRPCHSWLGRNIDEARELGLIAGKGEWNKKED